MDAERATVTENEPLEIPGFCLPVIEQSPLPMALVVGANYVLRWANPAFCRVIGKDQEEVIGKPFTETVPARDGCFTLLERVFRTGQPGSQTEPEGAEPHSLYGACAMWPILAADEHVAGVMIQITETAVFHEQASAMNEQLVISSMRQHELTETAEALNRQLQEEITERKAAERAMAEQARLLDLSNDAIIVRDVNNRITYWNHGAQELFGWTREEAIGQDLHSLLKTEFEIPLEDLLTKLRRENQLMGEVVQVARDGRRIHLLCRWSLDHDAHGNPASILTTTTDITERKRAEEDVHLAKQKAEAASSAKDDFLATLSHELRTPLTPVLMTASALSDDESLEAPVREQLAMIERNIELEARLIDDLLDLTRVSRGKLVLHMEPCDVHTLIRFVVEMVRGDAEKKTIHLSLDLAAERSRLTGDPARLQQVFWNLLRNAVKFTPAGGHIEICTRNVDNHESGRRIPCICIEVSDDGIGLEPATVERIFEPFEQAGARPEHRFGGLGLGLAIARAVVVSHHGVIRAQSAGLGCGTTFIVELPETVVAPDDVPAVPRAPSSDATQEATPPMRLLVVEDDESTLQVLTRLLTRAGHQVSGVASTADARVAAASHHFDAVVSDLGLPDGSGIDLMHELRVTYGLSGIALSGYGMEEDLRRSKEAGFTAHLVKPIDMNDLHRALSLLAQATPT